MVAHPFVEVCPVSDALPNPFAEDLAAAAQAMRDALKDEDPRIRIYAARSITLAATHIQRTNAYIQRCEVLNDRTASGASRTAHSAPRHSSDDWTPTKGDPRKKKPFGADLSPGDTDPQTGWVVPEEHICQIRKDAPENHVMAHCMLPGYKTKADLERAVYTFIDRDNRIYNELKAAQSELNVFRSERLGSITLEKREELLAGRFEKNNKRRQVYGTPTFLAELPQLTPELLAAKPVPPLEELLPSPTGAGSSSLPSPTGDSPHSLPFPTGEMSRGSASDREGVSHSPDTERSRRAGREGKSPSPTGANLHSLPSPTGEMSRGSASDREGVSLSPDTERSRRAERECASSVAPQDSRPKTQDVLSPLAAARRAAGKRPHPLLPVRLNHPTPMSRPTRPP